MEHFMDALKKYSDFKGRSTRRQFWAFILFKYLFYFGLSFTLVPIALIKKDSLVGLGNIF